MGEDAVTAELSGLLGEDVDGCVYAKDALLLQVLLEEQPAAGQGLDYRIARLCYLELAPQSQERVVALLNRLRQLRTGAAGCTHSTYRSLHAILGAEGTARLVTQAGGLSTIVYNRPGRLAKFDAVKTHPFVLAQEDRTRAARFLSCKIALAARVDYCGGEAFDFSDALRKYGARAQIGGKAPRPERQPIKSHRGGLRRRRRIKNRQLLTN
ncbi:hypothetical protein PAPHI01_0153 [Pancytospora philotis]|nr:hypothetical protein PAPHI01_0153 [Pancytospora philotis]